MANPFRGHSLSYGREVKLPTLASAAFTLTLSNLNHAERSDVADGWLAARRKLTQKVNKAKVEAQNFAKSS